MPHQRILLKLSGEALMGQGKHGIDPGVIQRLAAEIHAVASRGVQLGVVIGGGNIVRGAGLASQGMNRVTGDHMGMLATIINSLALQDSLEKSGVVVRTQSAINVQSVAEPYIRRRAMRHLEKGRVVVFAAGTGNPYMTTDTAASLRAIEIEAEALLMAKNGVDGVYDADPRQNPGAKRFEKLTYLDALNQRLQIMDATALSLCMDNKLPIIVFDLLADHGIERVVSGEVIGTMVSG